MSHSTSTPPWNIIPVISSPLSSPCGYSSDKQASKKRKKPKSSVTKKPGPKKKDATKPKTKKVRKGESNDPVALSNDIASPAGTGECSRIEISENSTISPLPPIENSETRVDISSQLEKHTPLLTAESITHPSPGIKIQAEKVILKESVPIDEGMTTPINSSKTLHTSQSGSEKPNVQPNQSNQDLNSRSGIGKSENNKPHRKRNSKRMSLAEIIASTNPKTKRGLRIGLPKEEKHRLHININPKPVVQKQVKKKLRVKRGEYDSGEDDPLLKANPSDSETEEDKQGGKQLVKSKLPPSQDDVEVDDPDEDVTQTADLDDEEY